MVVNQSQGLTMCSVGDNRDRVGDILYFLLQNSPDSAYLPTYDQILMYGCWCQLHHSNWALSNKGTPVDHLDNACRTWYKVRNGPHFTLGLPTDSMSQGLIVPQMTQSTSIR